jgi:hypothetical protein
MQGGNRNRGTRCRAELLTACTCRYWNCLPTVALRISPYGRFVRLVRNVRGSWMIGIAASFLGYGAGPLPDAKASQSLASSGWDEA